MRVRGGGSLPSPLVFWDGFGLAGTYSGILTHALELLKEIKNLGVNPTVIGQFGIERNLPKDSYVLISNNNGLFRLNKLKVLWPFLVDKKIRELSRGRAHIVHGLSNFNVPFSFPNSTQKRVLTVHDVIPLLDPSVVSISYAIQFKIAISRAVQVADKIICVSNWTMQSLLSFFPEIEDRCTVIHNGITNMVDRRSNRYFVGSIELLSVARYEKYKRFQLLFDICSKLPRYYSLNLVTDQKGRDFCEKYASLLMRNHKLNVYVGISREKLDELYCKSHIYIHPSIYEGFNIPAIDAVMNGLPVVYTKGTGTEEIIGPSLGLSLSPKESAEIWIGAIEECVKLVNDSCWIKKSEEAVRKLPSWHQNAFLTKKIYQELL
jgi:glycosyltransferase involved in cell wall biosynthesis